MSTDPVADAWKAQLNALGHVIRTQRQLAKLSLRDLAALTDLSNAYLSQVERGMHEPSVRVLRAIAEALSMPADTLLRQAGLLDPEPEEDADPQATDPPLTYRAPDAMRSEDAHPRSARSRRRTAGVCGAGGTDRLSTATATRSPDRRTSKQSMASRYSFCLA